MLSLKYRTPHTCAPAAYWGLVLERNTNKYKLQDRLKETVVELRRELLQHIRHVHTGKKVIISSGLRVTQSAVVCEIYDRQLLYYSSLLGCWTMRL